LWKQYRCNEQACSQSKSDTDAYTFRRHNRIE
jgi:hypothetical protein